MKCPTCNGTGEREGYLNGLTFAINLRVRFARDDSASRAANDIREQLASEIERVKAEALLSTEHPDAGHLEAREDDDGHGWNRTIQELNATPVAAPSTSVPDTKGGKVYDKTEEYDMSGKMPPILFSDGRFEPSVPEETAREREEDIEKPYTGQFSQQPRPAPEEPQITIPFDEWERLTKLAAAYLTASAPSMPEEIARLVERLKGSGWADLPTVQEAVTALERQAREIERLRGTRFSERNYDAMHSRACVAEAELKEVKAEIKRARKTVQAMFDLAPVTRAYVVNSTLNPQGQLLRIREIGYRYLFTKEAR